MIRQRLITMFAVCLYIAGADACTSAIISGRKTADGRPIMWKNRDSRNLANCVARYEGEKFDYVAIVNGNDATNPKSVWMGTNSAGFSIMNTLSYNITPDKKKQSGLNNGSLMKRALEICKDVADFRVYLDTLQRPRHVRSNYGVIDANGGASYFEVDDERIFEFDVNDTTIAPEGFLVRTNYSVNGRTDEGMGYVRYQQAYAKLHDADFTEITPRWLFSNLSRSFVNPLMGVDLTSGRYNKPYTNGWFSEEDFIARRTSSCAVAIQGVIPGEAPELIAMWVVGGYPPVTPAIPIWNKTDNSELPTIVSYDVSLKNSPLCAAADSLRSEIYSYKQGDNALDYFHWELLYNNSGTGYMQKLNEFEKSLFELYQPIVDKQHERGKLNMGEIRKLYEETEKMIREFMSKTNKL